MAGPNLLGMCPKSPRISNNKSRVDQIADETPGVDETGRSTSIPVTLQ
jgi:hypothetical protein